MRLLKLHIRSIILAMNRIIKHPFEHLLNIMVITLIATILGGIITTHTNSQWQKNNITFPQIMVYINESATSRDVSKLEFSINNFSQHIIKNYKYISKEQGLQELQSDNQLKEVSSEVISLNNNPLPNILIINTTTSNIKVLNLLTSRISKLPFVTSVQMDEKYAMKINNLLNFIKDISTSLLIFFGLSLFLIIYNLIRLQMLQRTDEITVSRLIGASDSYIMRPLTYYAVVQIIIGTLIAFFLVNWFVNYLNILFINLNSLFGKAFILDKLSLNQLCQMLLTLIIFAVFAVFIAVKTIFHKNYTQ